jgi:integrase
MIINATFKYTFFNDWINENVASRIIWKIYEDMLVRPTKIKDRTYSDDELAQIEKFLHERQTRQPNYIPAYVEEWQFLTAMRRGEVAPLRWDSIDRVRLCIHVDSEQITVKGESGCENSNKIVPYTKNGTERDYPLADLELEFLERLWKVHELYYPDSPYLFPAKNKNGRITNDTVYQFHRRMLQKLRIPVSRECMRGTHAFRRTRISEAAAASNGDLQMVALLYGNSPETIRSHYLVDNDLERKRQVLNSRPRH